MGSSDFCKREAYQIKELLKHADEQAKTSPCTCLLKCLLFSIYRAAEVYWVAVF